MVQAIIQELGEAERLALTSAPPRVRERYLGFFGLDAALRRIALTTSEPMLAQLRWAWWRDACQQPLAAGHPVLEILAKWWSGSTEPLIALVDGWEEAALAESTLEERALVLSLARTTVAAHCAELARPLGEASVRCWACMSLISLADGETERNALLSVVQNAPRETLPRNLRPVAVLGGLARRAALRGEDRLLGDRMSPFAAIRLGILGR